MAGGGAVWAYVLMPFIAGFIGYATNVVAIFLTFYPLEFWPLKVWQMHEQPFGLFGWQGIIPCKSAKMAAICCDLMMGKLIDVQEVFSRIEPALFVQALDVGLLDVTDEIVQTMAHRHAPKAWASLTDAVRDEVTFRALALSRQFTESFLADIAADITEVFDMKQMVIKATIGDKALMNEVFMKCGAQEFIFVERSGFYFGFLFGLVQTVVWYYYQAVWVLPLAGFLCGWATNALALKCIFRPLNPVPVCGGWWVLQGLFIKRQAEVSKVFAKVIAQRFVTAERMWEEVLTGDRRHVFAERLHTQTRKFAQNMTDELPAVVRWAVVDPAASAALQDEVAELCLALLPQALPYAHAYTDEVLEVERTLREAMVAMSPVDFEGVLRPAFEEDELKLILIGAVLGALAGLAQLVAFFGEAVE